MPSLKTIHHLFFADDAILLSDTISGLRKDAIRKAGTGGQLG